MTRAGSHSLDYLVLGIVIMLAVLLTIMAVCKVCKVIQTFFCASPNYYFDERPPTECIKPGGAVRGGGAMGVTTVLTGPPTSLSWAPPGGGRTPGGGTTPGAATPSGGVTPSTGRGRSGSARTPGGEGSITGGGRTPGEEIYPFGGGRASSAAPCDRPLSYYEVGDEPSGSRLPRMRTPWSALRMWWRRRTLYQYSKDTWRRSPGGAGTTPPAHRTSSLAGGLSSECDMAETPTASAGMSGSMSSLVGAFKGTRPVHSYLSNVDIERTAHV